MLKIFLTGSIASGKSFYSKKLAEIDNKICVLDSDFFARQAVEPKSFGLNKIVKHFGKKILLPDGSLNRKILRKIIFDDENERVFLEKTLHPIIQNLAKEKFETISKSNLYDVIIYQVPLISKTKIGAPETVVISLELDYVTQIERVMFRDRVTKVEAKRIITSQGEPDFRKFFADTMVLSNIKSEVTLLELQKIVAEYKKNFLTNSLQNTSCVGEILNHDISGCGDRHECLQPKFNFKRKIIL